jgi:hypothetical protein
VSRFTDPEGNKVGGNEGQALVQLSETEWKSPFNGIVWRVLPSGDLAAYKNEELVYAGRPCTGLWGEST